MVLLYLKVCSTVKRVRETSCNNYRENDVRKLCAMTECKIAVAFLGKMWHNGYKTTPDLHPNGTYAACDPGFAPRFAAAGRHADTGTIDQK